MIFNLVDRGIDPFALSTVEEDFILKRVVLFSFELTRSHFDNLGDLGCRQVDH